MFSNFSGTSVSELFRDACKLGEANLRMQQDMMTGWSRLWPGIYARTEGTSTPFADAREQWSETIQDLAQKQRALVNQQFDFARRAVDLTFGVTESPPTPVVTPEAPSPKVAKPAQEAPPATVRETAPPVGEHQVRHHLLLPV